MESCAHVRMTSKMTEEFFCLLFWHLVLRYEIKFLSSFHALPFSLWVGLVDCWAHYLTARRESLWWTWPEEKPQIPNKRFPDMASASSRAKDSPRWCLKTLLSQSVFPWMVLQLEKYSFSSCSCWNCQKSLLLLFKYLFLIWKIEPFSLLLKKLIPGLCITNKKMLAKSTWTISRAGRTSRSQVVSLFAPS